MLFSLQLGINIVIRLRSFKIALSTVNRLENNTAFANLIATRAMPREKYFQVELDTKESKCFTCVCLNAYLAICVCERESGYHELEERGLMSLMQSSLTQGLFRNRYMAIDQWKKCIIPWSVTEIFY